MAPNDFYKPSCVALLRDAHDSWARSCNDNTRAMHRTQETVRVNTSGVYAWYIRNQKVASHVVIAHLRREFDKRPGRSPMFMIPYHTRPNEVYPARTTHGLHNYVFTVVRDPLKAAQSAYLEVSRRRWLPPRLPKGETRTEPSYRSMPCSGDPLARYAAFLRAVRDGAPLGPELFHAFPQALKLSGATRYDRIIPLEDPAVEAAALKRETGIDLLGRLLSERVAGRNLSQSAEWAGCATPIELSRATDEVVRLYCRLYRVDYACGLGYELPSACQRVFGRAEGFEGHT